MGARFTLGRIAGIPIAIDWTWPFIVVLIVWTLADGVFPETNPGLSDGTYVTMAIVAALLFFTSLLLHELGHALEARRERVAIAGITLWILGGVAQFTGRIPSAAAEFRISVAGPAVSLVLGGGFALAAWLAPLPEPADAVCAWLGYTNLVLLAFNLIPAFPLDGGRVLRSLLWQRSGDLGRATRTAAGLGRTVAFGMIGLGVALLLAGAGFAGVWLGFIGWFLLQAAGAEAQQATLDERLGRLRVRDLMTPAPVTVDPELTLAAFVDDIVWRARFTTYPVAVDGEPVGLLPFRAVAEVPREKWPWTRVRERMVPLVDVPVLDLRTPAIDALPLLAGSRERRALVLDRGRLVGLLSITDLVRAIEIGGPDEAEGDSG